MHSLQNTAVFRRFGGSVLREVSGCDKCWPAPGSHELPAQFWGALLLLRGAATKWQKDFEQYSFWYLEYIHKLGLLGPFRGIQCLSASLEDLWREDCCSPHWLESAWSGWMCSCHKLLAGGSSALLGAAWVSHSHHVTISIWVMSYQLCQLELRNLQWY